MAIAVTAAVPTAAAIVTTASGRVRINDKRLNAEPTAPPAAPA